MSKIGIIANACYLQFPHVEITTSGMVETPYGATQAPLQHGQLQGKDVVLLIRNGEDGAILPHKINYRANLWALKEAGVSTVLAFLPVNGIRADIIPGSVVIPDQIIDYTHSRAHTFYEDDCASCKHIDFRLPYAEDMRQVLLTEAGSLDVNVIDTAVYGVTQGPHSETLAEINRLERDGCDMVGMSGMPETILARELDLDYACIALSANRAAGRNASVCINRAAMSEALKQGIQDSQQLIEQFVSNYTII